MKLIEPAAITDTQSFSRSSTARFYTVDGRLGTAPANEPRLNYPPERRIYAPAGWLAGPSLLIPTIPMPGMTVVPSSAPQFLAEGASTNVMLQSQDLTSWTATAATVTANTAVAPDGTTTADLIKASAADTALHVISQAATLAVAGGPAGASIFLRAAGQARARFRCSSASGAAGFEMLVDLGSGDIPSAGAFGTGASLNEARIVVLASGWYRLELEGEIAGASVLSLSVALGDGTTSFVGDGLTGVEAWGCGLEAGEVSSYVPTAASATTRAADVGTPMMVTSVAEDEPVYSSSSTYAQNVTVRGNTPATAHNLYVSLIAANVGKALTDKTAWLPAGATNRWRMFDRVVGSQTIDANSITVVVTSSKRLTALALMNVDAAFARVTVTDRTEGVVYDRTISLISTNGISNWWSWFFNDIEKATQKVLLDLPPYAGVQITITLSNPGNTVRCGACVLGRWQKVGATQYGASVGLTDYSTKSRDEFGNAIIKERPFSRRTTLPVMVPNSGVDQLVDQMARFRATPIVYIGSELFGSTIIYGFYKDFSVVIDRTEDSLLNLELESLV